MRDADYLAHIERAIGEIRAHTAGMTQDQYEADTKTQRAIVHQYFGVDQKILWDVLQEDLEPLLGRVRTLLAGDTER